MSAIRTESVPGGVCPAALAQCFGIAEATVRQRKKCTSVHAASRTRRRLKTILTPALERVVFDLHRIFRVFTVQARFFQVLGSSI